MHGCSRTQAETLQNGRVAVVQWWWQLQSPCGSPAEETLCHRRQATPQTPSKDIKVGCGDAGLGDGAADAAFVPCSNSLQRLVRKIYDGLPQKDDIQQVYESDVCIRRRRSNGALNV